MTIKMIAPAGLVGVVNGQSGSTYTIGSDGTITGVVPVDVLPLLSSGWALFGSNTRKVSLSSPLPADLVSISSAAIATNRALTIAAQPPHARKLQVRIVIVTAITAGILTLIGTDQDGNAVTEVVSLIAAATATLKSVNAYAHLTSATVTGLVGGGDGTLGLGLSNDFGVPTLGSGAAVAALVCTKATKITKVYGTSSVAADDVASTTVVDSVARTIAPTTAPAASGVLDFELTYSYSAAA